MTGITLVAAKHDQVDGILLKHALQDVINYIDDVTDNEMLMMQQATYRAFKLVKDAFDAAWDANLGMEVLKVYDDASCQESQLNHAIDDVLHWLWVEHGNDTINMQPATRRALSLIQEQVVTT
jgi:hypothetical protein